MAVQVSNPDPLVQSVIFFEFGWLEPWLAANAIEAGVTQLSPEAEVVGEDRGDGVAVGEGVSVGVGVPVGDEVALGDGVGVDVDACTAC